MEIKEEGKKLKQLREEQGLSLRRVAKRSGVSPANLSLMENGHISPTLTSLHKVLEALGYTFAEFFGENDKPMEEPVFRKKDLKSAKGAYRKYTFLLPKKRQIRVELLLEEWMPQHNPGMEIAECDVAGHLLDGGPIELEIEGEGKWEMNEGDSFYIPSGHKHRGINKGKKAARLLTCFYPPRY